MSEENVETVRRAVERFNELGFDGFGTSDLVTDDVEFHEPPEQPARAWPGAAKMFES